MTGGRPILSPSRGSGASPLKLTAAIVSYPGGVDQREMTVERPIPSPSRGSRANEVRLAAAIVTSPGGVDERETAGPTATIDVEGSATMKNRGPRHG
jgi:hypothetical protein